MCHLRIRSIAAHPRNTRSLPHPTLWKFKTKPTHSHFISGEILVCMEFVLSLVSTFTKESTALFKDLFLQRKHFQSKVWGYMSKYCSMSLSF